MSQTTESVAQESEDLFKTQDFESEPTVDRVQDVEMSEDFNDGKNIVDEDTIVPETEEDLEDEYAEEEEVIVPETEEIEEDMAEEETANDETELNENGET